MNQSEIGAFFARLAAEQRTNPDAEVRFPMFLDDDGEPIPDALFDALDGDDAAALNEAALDFLPRRFRPTSPVSRPFDKPQTGRIAVKVINHYGDEVLKVYAVT